MEYKFGTDFSVAGKVKKHNFVGYIKDDKLYMYYRGKEIVVPAEKNVFTQEEMDNIIDKAFKKLNRKVKK